MSKQNFLANYRVARNLFNDSQARQLDPLTLKRLIGRVPIWLTSKSDGGFDENDFPELAPDRRKDLADNVQEFLTLATQGQSASATPDQLERALAAFRKVDEILAPEVPESNEGTCVREALQSVQYPDWVASWDFNLYDDWTDDPAVNILLIVDENAAPNKITMMRLLQQMEHQIRQGFSRANIERWPYVHMSGLTAYKPRV